MGRRLFKVDSVEPDPVCAQQHAFGVVAMTVATPFAGLMMLLLKLRIAAPVPRHALGRDVFDILLK